MYLPLVAAVLGNDNAATKGSSITFGTTTTTFNVFRCNSGDWRIWKEFTTEAEAIAWCDEKLGSTNRRRLINNSTGGGFDRLPLCE